MKHLAEEQYTERLGTGRLIEVIHRDYAGRILRISKYLLEPAGQKPVSELIFDSHGDSTLYVYSESGENVEKVIQSNLWGASGQNRRHGREKKIY